jgi:hypothetical protein
VKLMGKCPGFVVDFFAGQMYNKGSTECCTMKYRRNGHET